MAGLSEAMTVILVPVLVDDVHLDLGARNVRRSPCSMIGLDAGEFLESASQPWAEPEAEHRTQNEHVVRSAARVGVMRADPQPSPVVHEAVQPHAGHRLRDGTFDAMSSI